MGAEVRTGVADVNTGDHTVQSSVGMHHKGVRRHSDEPAAASWDLNAVDPHGR